MASRRLTTALIGCGQIADAHLQELRRIGTASVAAVCDVHPRPRAPGGGAVRCSAGLRQRRAHARRGAAGCGPYHHPASDPSPAGAAMSRGRGAPLRRETFHPRHRRSRRGIRAAEMRDLRVCLGHDQLFDPAWEECRHRVSAGDVGEIVHVDAYSATTWQDRLDGR